MVYILNMTPKHKNTKTPPKHLRNGLHIEYATKAQKHQNPTKRSSEWFTY